MSEQERAEVASDIAENIDALTAILNFVTAEPGFAIVDGAIVKVRVSWHEYYDD